MTPVDPSPFKGKTGIRRLFNALGYSLDGLKAALQHEAAFRQLTVLAAILIPVACLLSVSMLERVVLIAAVLATLLIELLNAAVEAAVDHTSLARHPLAKRAKDLGSAAQLVGLVNLAVVWGGIVGGG